MEHMDYIFASSISSENRSKNMVDNGYLLCFRWLELLVEPRRVSDRTKLAVLSNRHQSRQT
jgi:hypothetical protein